MARRKDKAAAEPENLISLWFGRVAEAGRLMCGVPDYDTYVAHMKNTHPDQEAMTYEAFFENRMNAKFNGGGMKACC